MALFKSWLLVAIFLSQRVHKIEAAWNIGILIVEKDGSTNNDDSNVVQLFCLKCYPSLYNFTRERSNATRYNLSSLMDLNNVDSCDKETYPQSGIEGKFAFLNISVSNNSSKTAVKNCTVADRAGIVQELHGIGMLADTALSGAKKNANLIEIDFPVAAMLDTGDIQKLRKLIADENTTNEKRLFAIYTPEERNFDASLFVIMAMAVVTVGIGSLWSGYVKHYLRLHQLRQLDPNGDQTEGESNGTNGNKTNRGGNALDDEERIYEQANSNGHGGAANEEISLKISPAYIIFFVFLMCGMLVMLYFFFDYLVYVIIGMFFLATTIAVYSCFEPLIMWTYEVGCMKCIPTVRLPKCNLYLCIINMELRQALLLVASVAISTVWLVFRKAGWAWILQDILGILFSINMLKVLRLPSLKICTILLSTLFIYDIFFVFITPLITKDGKSIMESAVTGGKSPDGKSVMVEVATGGNTGEQLPMVLKVPHLSGNPDLKACGVPYSMLGFGDILVPGLLLSYCHSFDLYVGTSYKLYWLITNVAYSLGIVATFLSLYLMRAAQPALLFLVPFTLVPVFVVSLVRGDFSAMWQGDFTEKPQSTSQDPSGNNANASGDESDPNHCNENGIIDSGKHLPADGTCAQNVKRRGSNHDVDESHILADGGNDECSQHHQRTTLRNSE